MNAKQLEKGGDHRGNGAANAHTFASSRSTD
jgi:hypothetical protein